MGRPGGMSRMVHDYKERETMKEAGRFWEVETDMGVIRVESDLTGEIGFITVSQREGGSGDITFEVCDAEGLIKSIREAASLVRRRYPDPEA